VSNGLVGAGLRGYQKKKQGGAPGQVASQESDYLDGGWDNRLCVLYWCDSLDGSSVSRISQVVSFPGEKPGKSGAYRKDREAFGPARLPSHIPIASRERIEMLCSSACDSGNGKFGYRSFWCAVLV
jgi:hypothetical protein